MGFPGYPGYWSYKLLSLWGTILYALAAPQSLPMSGALGVNAKYAVTGLKMATGWMDVDGDVVVTRST